MPVRMFVGACGSGKTYSMQKLVAASALRSMRHGDGFRFLAYDVNSEWPDRHAMAGVRWTKATTLAEAYARLAKHRVVVFRPPSSVTSKGTKKRKGDATPNYDMAQKLAEVCIARSGVILCLPEIHTSASSSRVPPAMVDLLTRYRHNRCGLWFDTQRITQAPTMARAAATTLYLFAAPTNGSNRTMYDDIGGPELIDAIDRCGDLATGRDPKTGRIVRPKAPGWHVRLTQLSARPPYELRRL